jgi:hypothetical protein
MKYVDGQLAGPHKLWPTNSLEGVLAIEKAKREKP